MQEIHTILDVGSNVGGWVQDVARAYPHVHIIGIDIEENLLRRATLLARVNGVSRVTFQAMDATVPLLFPNNHFDLIHMRSAIFIPPNGWFNVINELTRVLRPGGWLNLIEFEHGLTSSAAFNHLMQLIAQPSTSLSASSEQHIPLSNSSHLYSRMLASGLTNVSYTLYAVDLGIGNTPTAREFVRELLKTIPHFKRPLMQAGMLDAAAFDTLFAQAQRDLMHPDMCGYAYIISALGCKNG